MARTEGIIQSANRAWGLIQDTGFMDSSRGLNTEAWQRNVAEANRELREAAASLVAENNRDAYGELSSQERATLWQAILAARAQGQGFLIISSLGTRYPAMRRHVLEAAQGLSSRANGFPVAELRHMANEICNRSPDPATVIERRASREGDPPPERVSPDEAQLYSRIMLRAMQQSDREESSYRNAGDAALGAFGASLLPPITPEGMAQNWGEEQALDAALGSRANAAGLVLSALRAVSDGVDAHRRATDDEYRLQYWVREVCMAESDGNAGPALALFRRLQNILERMNAWLEWLQRHRDHPSFVPPGGEWRADPTASLDHTRTGSGNRSGPVQGSVRGAFEPGPNGLA